MLTPMLTGNSRLGSLFSRKRDTARYIATGCREAMRQYDAPSTRVWLRFLRQYARRFSPREIFLWGLLDPTLTSSDLAKYVSKETLLRIQRKHNPESYANLVEDKVVFYAQCSGFGLPTPQTLAILTRSGGWVPGEKSLSGWQECVGRLNTLKEDQFILKPDTGVYGRGVRMVGRNADGRWVDQHGNVFDDQGMKRYLTEQAAYDRFLIQERIHNHGQIAELTGLGTLQTVRVITVSDGRGEPGEIVLANWRIAGREGVTDNFDYGKGGSLLADVDAMTGRVRRVVGPNAHGNGIEVVRRHPVTDASLEDFSLPHWEEVWETLRRATVHFAPLRLIGWDVALSDSGPVLIEANARFDAGQNAFRALPTLIQRIDAVGR